MGSPRHSKRDQVRLLADRICAVWSVGLSHLQAQVEDGQRDWRQEDGRPSLAEVKRDGAVQLPATAATSVRHLQKLRGALASRFYGWQWCCDARQGGLM